MLLKINNVIAIEKRRKRGGMVRKKSGGRGRKEERERENKRGEERGGEKNERNPLSYSFHIYTFH